MSEIKHLDLSDACRLKLDADGQLTYSSDQAWSQIRILEALDRLSREAESRLAMIQEFREAAEAQRPEPYHWALDGFPDCGK